MSMRPNYGILNVVDLEATCGAGVDELGLNEIIEFGITQVDRRTLKIIKSDSILVRPSRSVVTQYCTDLTGHTQDELDRHGMPFTDACKKLVNEYNTNKYCWFSHGNYDFWMIHNQCRDFGIQNPMNKSHINTGMLFALLTRRSKGPGMAKMCDLMGIELEGRHHNGKDDSYNTAKCLIEMLKHSDLAKLY